MSTRAAGLVDAPADHLGLFNMESFHLLNVSGSDEIVRLDHVDDGRLVGSLVGVRRGDELCSGFSAPFGGPDFLRDAETPSVVVSACEAWSEAMDARGVRVARLRLPPEAYARTTAATRFALMNAGFSVERCELNLHLELAGMRDRADYVDSLRSPARRALRHLGREPFELREAASEEEWRLGHGLLRRNREAKGRALKLSADYVLGARDALPGRIRMLLLEHSGSACAAALVYAVKAGYLLVVYWGDADHSLSRSPMNLLAMHVVDRAIADGARVLDLGISSLDGRPDPGLIQFKRSVGAREGLRLDLARRP